MELSSLKLFKRGRLSALLLRRSPRLAPVLLALLAPKVQLVRQVPPARLVPQGQHRLLQVLQGRKAIWVILVLLALQAQQV